MRLGSRNVKLIYLDAAYNRTPEDWIDGLSDPTNKPGMMQRMRMEALGMPGASDIHVDKMPPPDRMGDSRRYAQGSLCFSPRLHKSSDSGTRVLRCRRKPSLPVGLIARGRRHKRPR
jgi:hypothetical protein